MNNWRIVCPAGHVNEIGAVVEALVKSTFIAAGKIDQACYVLTCPDCQEKTNLELLL